MGTYCPDFILLTTLALIGGSADDRTIACPEVAGAEVGADASVPVRAAVGRTVAGLDAVSVVV